MLQLNKCDPTCVLYTQKYVNPEGQQLLINIMENSTGIQVHDASLSLLDDISSSNELNKHVYFSLKKVKKKAKKKSNTHTSAV